MLRFALISVFWIALPIGSLRAAPFINLTLEGRILGSDAEFSDHLDVDLGDVVEYRVRAEVAPIGTTNEQYGKTLTIDQLVPARDGINSVSLLTLFQSSGAGIHAHFKASAVPVTPWDNGTGARGGVPTARAGLPWNDLVDMRAIQAPATFSAIDPETLFLGTFSVEDVSGPFATLDVRWRMASGMKINNGRTLFPNYVPEDPLDPLLGYQPMTLTSPFDVGEKSITIDYSEPDESPEALLREQIVSGRGAPGIGNGTWTGRGITSSAAAAENAVHPETYSVGYADNSALPLGAVKTFGGKALDASEILIRFTRTGDANLDGIVNDEDVTIVAANYALGVQNPQWALGDFDYNGFVDDDDVTLLGVLYDPTAAPLPAPAGDANTVTAIPEPSSVVLAALAALTATIGIVMRRRRPQS